MSFDIFLVRVFVF